MSSLLPASGTITARKLEPIVIQGNAFPAFAGVAVDRIVLYRIVDGAWVEIPSQVDERFVENVREHQPFACRVDWDPCERTWLLSGIEDGAGAYDFDGTLGPESAEAAVTVVDTWPPPLPGGIIAEAGSHRAIISWEAHHERDIDKVFVNMATESGGPYYRMNPGGSSGSQTAVVVLNLQSAQTYYFTVTTEDVAGNESEHSFEMPVTPTQ